MPELLWRPVAAHTSGRLSAEGAKSSPEPERSIAGVAGLCASAPSIQSPEREEPPLSPLSFDELLELLTDEERWWSSPEADEQAHIDERAGAPPAPLAPAQEISAVWDPAPHDLFIPHPASPSKGAEDGEDAPQHAVVEDSSEGPPRTKMKWLPETEKGDSTVESLATASASSVPAEPGTLGSLKRPMLSRGKPARFAGGHAVS
ncbi:hypothetical protein CSUI_007289 [Cystoisospora suis]|uniref:Uncharacterized protein n=1 Tax=Cystoisospora suis TaxID=483139 RepID=A0A2C6KRE9_9APIC|nr:hypothetical protein CSUI_007289 [Cystoisospora suis]